MDNRYATFVQDIADRIAQAGVLENEQVGKTYAIFDVGGSRYGTPITHIREIVRIPPLTPIPNAPAYIQGVFSTHGKIVPVIDVERRFIESSPLTHIPQHIMLIEKGESLYGLMVERVVASVNILPHQISSFFPENEVNWGLARSFIKGIWYMEKKHENQHIVSDFLITSPQLQEIIPAQVVAAPTAVGIIDVSELLDALNS